MPGGGDPSISSIFIGEPMEWFHGSPLRLETLAAGSTVTPTVEVAKAFSHKPTRLDFETHDRDGEISTVVTGHNGTRHGYLYRVVVDDPATDLCQHSRSVMAPGEEMLTHASSSWSSSKRYRLHNERSMR